MSEWQTIDSAPRDRRVVLVYCPLPRSEYIVTALYDGDRWIDSYEGEDIFNPSHWQPLPDPPTPSA